MVSTDSGVVPLDESADAEDVGAAKAHVAANPAERSPSETVRLEAVWVEDPAAEAATAAVAYDRSAGAYAAAAADAGHLRSSVESRGVRLREADMARSPYDRSRGHTDRRRGKKNKLKKAQAVGVTLSTLLRA